MSVIVVVVPVSLNMCRFDMIFSAVFVLLYGFFCLFVCSYCSSSFHKIGSQLNQISFNFILKLNFFFFSTESRTRLCTFFIKLLAFTFYNVCVRYKVYSSFLCTRNQSRCSSFFLLKNFSLKINTPVNSDYHLLGLLRFFSSLECSLRSYNLSSVETWTEGKRYDQKIARRTCRHIYFQFDWDRGRGREIKKSMSTIYQFAIYDHFLVVRVVWKFWRSFTVKMLLMSHKLWVWPFVHKR